MTFFQNILRSGIAPLTDAFAMRSNASLKVLDSDNGFIALGMKIRKNGPKHSNCTITSHLSDKKLSMLLRIFEIARLIEMNREIKDSTESANRSWIGHFNTDAKNIARASSESRRLTSFNGDTAFTVEKSSSVSKIGQFYKWVTCIGISYSHLATEYTQYRTEFQPKNPANSADTRPCKDEGNAEPSITRKSEGVRREHIRDPKGMTCSDLRSNAKRTAEMTVPGLGRVTKVQDAKTAQILWMGTLGTNNRRKLGVCDTIDTTVTS